MSNTIVLIGPSGSGKSQVANELGLRLKYSVIDPSSLVAGDSSQLTQAFVQDPDGAEARLVDAAIQALRGRTLGTVIELPPSAPLAPDVREAVKALRRQGATVIYLDASLDTLARRSGLNAPQPGFLGTPRAWFRELNNALAEGYQGLYDLHCDTTHADPGTVAEQIIGVIAIN